MSTRGNGYLIFYRILKFCDNLNGFWYEEPNYKSISKIYTNAISYYVPTYYKRFRSKDVDSSKLTYISSLILHITKMITYLSK